MVHTDSEGSPASPDLLPIPLSPKEIKNGALFISVDFPPLKCRSQVSSVPALVCVSVSVSVCGGGGARGGGKEKESVGKRACLKIRKMLREANESRECYLWGSSERDPDSFV